MHIGKGYNRLARITIPKMKRYATRIHADFHLIDSKQIMPESTRWGHTCWEKQQMGFLIKQYTALLFVDLDCWISTSCPNIFKFYRNDGFVAHTWGATHQTFFQYAELCGLHQPKYELNSGVMVIRRSHEQLFVLPEVIPDPVEFSCSEQDWLAINAQLHGLPVTHMDSMFHCTNPSNEFWIFHAVDYRNVQKVHILRQLGIKELV